MNIRHAAALALVGWYMVTPPIAGDANGRSWIDFKKPVTQWTIVNKFDSKEDCRKALRYHELSAEKAGASGDAESKQLWQEAFSKAQCIAENDLLRNGGFIGQIR
jgi:hypothetical protein